MTIYGVNTWAVIGAAVFAVLGILCALGFVTTARNLESHSKPYETTNVDTPPAIDPAYKNPPSRPGPGIVTTRAQLDYMKAGATPPITIDGRTIYPDRIAWLKRQLARISVWDGHYKPAELQILFASGKKTLGPSDADDLLAYIDWLETGLKNAGRLPK